MGHRWYCISLKQSTYTGNPFWLPGEAQPKYEYSLSWRQGSILGLVAGEDKKWVLNILPVALPKHEIDLVF